MESVKIVIIGAGIAGISAAHRLISNGFSDVTILEGEGRIGGRIRTDSYGSGIIEMGAQWIHGEDNNPVYDLAAGNDLVDQTKDFEDTTTDNVVTLDDHLFYTSCGKLISPTIVNETFTVLDYSFKDATKFARNQLPPNNADETVGTFVQNAFRNYLERSDDPDEVKQMKESLFNWRLLKETIENGCTSIYDMSLYAWGEYIECPGNEEVVLRHGYKPVLEVLTDKIPNGLFRLNTHVQQIVWPSNDQSTMSAEISSAATNFNLLRNSCGGAGVSKVRVISLKNEVFEADHVIVTCSLGYLKRHRNEMFTPALPDQKVSAIDRLGFGTVNKIYLEFERPFSEKICANIQLAWLPDDSFIPSKYQNENLFDNKWYKGIHGFELVDNQPCLLCGWIAGREAELMESLPDDLVVDVCQDLLQTFTGDRDIPRPIKITRSKWFSNVYSVGSYSYRQTGSTVSDCCELAKPLPSPEEPSLLFAGEATHDAYFSTTHGAYLSGQREAARIINLYRQVPQSTISTN